MNSRIVVRKENNGKYNIGIRYGNGHLTTPSHSIAEEDLGKYFTPETVTFLKNEVSGTILKKEYLITLVH